jgi:hypothetical protein
MPVLAAILYWIRILRRPMDARLKRRYVGEFAIGFGAAAPGHSVDRRAPERV